MGCELIDRVRASLPPMFSIDEALKLMPGVFSNSTLRKAMMRGDGPEVIRIGRRVALERDSFCDWLAARGGEAD